MRSGSEQGQTGGALLAPGPPPPPPRPPLPGPVAPGKRSCPCYFCLPSWLGCPQCHPHDLTLRGTGILAEPPAGPQPLVLTQVGGPFSDTRAPADGALCAGVFAGYPASKCGMARPVWACPVPHTSTLSTLYRGTGVCPVRGAQGGPCMSSVSSPCCAALFPQGKFRTLIAVSNQTALYTGTNLWPRGSGQAQANPFCYIPLCPSLSPPPLGHHMLYIGPSPFPHRALYFPIDLTLAVLGPDVSTSQEEKREAGSPVVPQAACSSYASVSYSVGTLSTSPGEEGVSEGPRALSVASPSLAFL